MKRIIYILSFVLLACSCSDKFLEKDAPSLIRQYNCVIRENSTKTFIDSNLSQSWSAGDEISVFSDTYNREFVFQGKDGDKSGFFTEKIQDFEFYTSWEIDGTVAVYPYNPATTINEDRHVSLYVPEVQEYHVNTYDPAANIMVAYNTSEDDENLTFHNMCGYLAVPVSSSIIAKRVTLTANCAVAGWSDILFSDSGPEIKVQESRSNAITIDCGQGIALSENESEPTMFIFAIPPVILEEGFTVEVEDIEGLIYRKKTEKSREIVCNGYVQMETWKIAPYELKSFCYPGTDKPVDLIFYDGFWTDENYSVTMKYIELEDGWHCVLTPVDGLVEDSVFPLRFVWDRTSVESSWQSIFVKDQVSNIYHPDYGMISMNQSAEGVSYFDGDRMFYFNIQYTVPAGSFGSYWSTLRIRTEDEIKPINIPDPVFLQYCLDNFDTDNNKEISVDEARNVYRIDVDTKDIESLEGIGEFVNLRYLYCRLPMNYYVHSDDGSFHYFDVDGNEISGIKSLDVSKNTALTELYCGWNLLSKLDVSNNPQLEVLFCPGCQLESLDVSMNPNLTNMDCSYNQLSKLDISNNANLASLGCGDNKLSELNVSNNVALHTLSCINNQLTGIDVANNVALKTFSCAGNQISSLDVSNNVNLTVLVCGGNNLTSLDISKNVALHTLSCYSNYLTGIDVASNVALSSLSCQNNQISSLDVSNNVNLTSLDCSGNNLTSLDVSGNSGLTSLSCKYNPSLSEIWLTEGQTIGNFEYDEGVNINYKSPQ